MPASANRFTRREILQLSLMAGGALVLPQAEGRGLGENFDFLAVNDLHYHDAACDAWFTEVFAAMKESAAQAEFILLGGDLADEGKPEQLAGLRALLPQLGIPWHAVPGNHDCTAAGDRSAYQELFPGQDNSTFSHRGWRFIGLDTAEGDQWHDTTIAAATVRYLENELSRLAKETPLVVFTHFPLGDHIVLPPQKPGAPSYNFRPVNADELLGKLEGFNLQAVFCGHFHGFTERTRAVALLTTDKCCSRVQKNHDGTLEKGWFVCEARAGRVTRRFVEIPKSLRS